MKKLLTETNPYTGIALNTILPWLWCRLSAKTRSSSGGPTISKGGHVGNWSNVSRRLPAGNTVDSKGLVILRGVTVRGDGAARGVSAPYPTFELTKGDRSPRLVDQVEFMANMECGFFADMKNYLQKESGARQLITASNFGSADPGSAP